MPELNDAQRGALHRVCERYRVEFDPKHYIVFPADSIMTPGWAEGWVGGDHANTIYVGVSPEGEVHS